MVVIGHKLKNKRTTNELLENIADVHNRLEIRLPPTLRGFSEIICHLGRSRSSWRAAISAGWGLEKWVDMRHVQRPVGGYDDQSCGWTIQTALKWSTTKLIEPPCTRILLSEACVSQDVISALPVHQWVVQLLATARAGIGLSLSCGGDSWGNRNVPGDWKRQAEGHERNGDVSRVVTPVDR